MQVIRLPPGNVELDLKGQDTSALKYLDHELWWEQIMQIICPRCGKMKI